MMVLACSQCADSILWYQVPSIYVLSVLGLFWLLVDVVWEALDWGVWVFIKKQALVVGFFLFFLLMMGLTAIVVVVLTRSALLIFQRLRAKSQGNVPSDGRLIARFHFLGVVAIPALIYGGWMQVRASQMEPLERWMTYTMPGTAPARTFSNLIAADKAFDPEGLRPYLIGNSEEKEMLAMEVIKARGDKGDLQRFRGYFMALPEEVFVEDNYGDYWSFTAYINRLDDVPKFQSKAEFLKWMESPSNLSIP